jgi:putative hydrolase
MPRRRAPADPVDVNLRIAGLLGDMAAIQTMRPRQLAYRQAAAVVRELDVPLDALVAAAGELPRLPRIGPSSSRIILEALADGSSPTVERAVDASGKREEIDRRRGLRRGFLSGAAVAQVLRDAGAYADLRADFQMHSTWSDGSQSLAEVSEGCLARGYSHAAITDHAVGLPIAGGVSMDRFVEQWREVDALNERYRGQFQLLKGVEANIGADGGLDVAPDDRRSFDLVLAAPHSALRSTGDQTERLLAVVTAPHVHVLAHPRGRKFGERPGLQADWPRVFAAAAEHDVAIEIDGDPSRQDLDHVLVADAVRAGCVIALDSDAHSRRELAYVETAMAHARLAAIPSDRILNCWPLERLLEWTSARRQ